MKAVLLLLVSLLLLRPGYLLAQDQELKVLGHNVLFGGFSAGLGAVVNKNKNENWKSAFTRGFWQGSIGGALNYSAKKTMFLVVKNENLSYALPARLLSSAGNSIIHNAALNEPFLQNWSLDYLMFRTEFSFSSTSKARVRLLPMSFIGSAIAAPNHKPDINTSLLTGAMVFKSPTLISSPNYQTDGINLGRAFVYMDRPSKYHVIAHEMIHEFQYRESMVINTYLVKKVSGIKDSRFKRAFTRYIYPDIPYFGIVYMIEGVDSGDRFYRNYFEFEAERFASNKYVPIR